ncbi:3193_t:CDS:2 [Acaulospora morrowiae]|uniref:3193_t:CDS:1 n=1 Tax=Acaulospora morrowiae TaxID=94023 RepID=A0A9N8WEK8_9GLOM|nr:3193_t:CDS:2 [Acaulospora morrowiae]
MESSRNLSKWLNDAIDNDHIIEFNYVALKNIEPCLITALSSIKKAYQIEFERNVALKYLKDDRHKSEDEYYRNFVREVQILTKLNAINNENIIRFLGISKGIVHLMNIDYMIDILK